MRLSDLMHSQVYDADGAKIGPVGDVVVIQDGPMLLPFGAAFRIDGLMVGHRSFGTRLGYVRGGVKGPWLLRAMFSALERRARYVPWDDVATWDGEVVRLRVRGGDLHGIDA